MKHPKTKEQRKALAEEHAEKQAVNAPRHDAPTALECLQASDVIHRLRMTWETPSVDDDDYDLHQVFRSGLDGGWRALIYAYNVLRKKELGELDG